MSLSTLNRCPRRLPRLVHTFRALVLLVCAVPLFAAQPSNSAASPAARATLDYLAGLKSQTSARLIVGQHVGYVSAIYASTIYSHRTATTPTSCRCSSRAPSGWA